MPIDPVCGIELDEKLALIHEHEGKKYYFCCNGCRKIFLKKPKKWKKKNYIGNVPHIRQNLESCSTAKWQKEHLFFEECNLDGASLYFL